MLQELDTSFECNRLIWLTCLPESEQGPFRRIVEDIAAWAASISLDFRHKQIESESQLIEVLTVLEVECKEKSIKPIVHFDIHGNKNQGLYIHHASKYVSWETIIDRFQKINFATKNNFVVILAETIKFSV